MSNLEFQKRTDWRWEFVGGDVYAMEGVAGNSVARTMRPRFSRASVSGSWSPSAKPFAFATDQLPVAIALGASLFRGRLDSLPTVPAMRAE